MKRLPKTWRSTTTRVVVSYGVFFALWALVLLLLIYWDASSYLSDEAERQLKERAEYFASVEPSELRDHLKATYGFDSLHINSYGLFDALGHPIAGHILSQPEDLAFDGASHIYHEKSGDGHDASTRVLAVRLGNGDVLLLARDAGLIDQIHALFLRAVIWGLALTLLPGIVGGVVLSIRPLKRIRSLQEASDRVVSGRLDERLPVSARGDELDMLASIVNRMLDEIERLMLEVKSAGDNIAHDLRTPLTHLRAQLYRMHQQMQQDDPRALIIDQAVVETDELLARFSALLRIAELRDEHRRAAFAEVDLNEVLEQVYSLYEPLAEEKSLRFSLDISGLAHLRGDRQLLIEAFSNLVANAIKFTPDGGRVLIRAVNEPNGPCVDVLDTGPGIAPQLRQSVFKRFYRADKSRSTPGFGLGLSIVDAIVRLHDFQVEAADAPSGACLTVRCWSREAALSPSLASAL